MYCFYRLWGIHLLCIWWGWSAPIEVTLYPIDSYYSLTRGIRPLERIINSPYPGGLLPPWEDYHLSLSILGDYHPLERMITSHSVPLGDYHPLLRISTSYWVPWGIITPRAIITPLGKSDLEFLIGVLHPLPLFPTNVLVVLFVYI